MVDLFGLLGYDCRLLKLERVKQDFVRGGSGSLFARAAPNYLPNLAKFNFNVCKHIPIC
jgi:hypothetical protein